MPRSSAAPRIGASGKRVIRLGAKHADVVEVGGLGPTLPDGHFHKIRWSTLDVDEIGETVRDAAGRAGRRPILGALVQHVEITDDPERVAARFLDDYVAATSLPRSSLPSVGELTAAPFMLVGSLTEILAKIANARDRWGFSRYTIRAPARTTSASSASTNTPTCDGSTWRCTSSNRSRTAALGATMSAIATLPPGRHTRPISAVARSGSAKWWSAVRRTSPASRRARSVVRSVCRSGRCDGDSLRPPACRGADTYSRPACSGRWRCS